MLAVIVKTPPTTTLTGKPFSLDESYAYARYMTGKAEADATKRVIAKKQELKRKTSQPPSSKASADAEKKLEGADFDSSVEMILQDAMSKGGA